MSFPRRGTPRPGWPPLGNVARQRARRHAPRGRSGRPTTTAARRSPGPARRRGGHADGIRRGARRAEARLQHGLGLGLGGGHHRVDVGGVAERHGNRDDDVDGARPPGRVQLTISRTRWRCRPGRDAQADRGRGVHPVVFALHHTGDAGRGEQPDALTAQAKAAGQLSYVRGRVHAAVGGGHLGVEHPLARPDPTTRHAAGNHSPTRARAPHRHRQPHSVRAMPAHLQVHGHRTLLLVLLASPHELAGAGLANSHAGTSLLACEMPHERGGRLHRDPATGRWHVSEGYEHHPVYWVTWIGAAAFAAWSNARLPTRAELIVDQLTGRSDALARRPRPSSDRVFRLRGRCWTWLPCRSRRRGIRPWPAVRTSR